MQNYINVRWSKQELETKQKPQQICQQHAEVKTCM